MIKNAWYVLGYSQELEHELLGEIICGRPVVAWRTRAGEVVAFDGRCRHKRFPLWGGKLVDDAVECAYHGWCYDGSGTCVAIPSQPAGKIPSRASLQPFPVVEQDGLVWIWPGDPDAAREVSVPRTEELAGDGHETVFSETRRARANYRLLIENVLDITHFYPLHDGNIGDIANSQIPVEVVDEEDGGNHAVMTIRSVENYRLPPYFADWFGLDVVDRVHTHRMCNPGMSEVRIRLAPPGELGTAAEMGYVLRHYQTPVDDQHIIWRWTMSCAAGSTPRGEPGVRLVDRIAASAPEVVDQDRWAIEMQQQMLDLDDDGYAEVNVKADVGVIHARRVLGELEQLEAGGAPSPDV
jgi:phenylpropionate dioxygenase-like ring-hydroxylating dioxygenase large terminal subunit